MTDEANKSIAVVGVSSDPEKYGHKIFVDLVEAGYKVWGVNPKGGSVSGRFNQAQNLLRRSPKPKQRELP